MSDDRHVKLLVEAYAEQRASLAERIVQALIALWLPFNWWSRPDMFQAYAAKSAVIVDGGARQARQIARAYAVEMLREIDALPESLPEIEDVYPRSGVELDRVYQRPARLRGWLESLPEVEFDDSPDDDEDDIEWDSPEEPDEDPETDDEPEDEPESRERETPDGYYGPSDPPMAFEDRIRELVEDDLTIAGNDEARRVYQAAPKVTGYRRIIHPELSRGGTCGLCLVASTRKYWKDELLPIHNRCKCTVSPITGEYDPGLNLSQADLEEIYAQGGSTYGEDLKKVRYKVELHGEKGPRLLAADHGWRSVDDVNEDVPRFATAWTRKTKDDDKAMWSGMLEHAQVMNERLAEAIIDGDSLVDIGGNGRRIDVPDIRQAMEHYSDFIAYARRRAA